jgi:hypothetical protein
MISPVNQPKAIHVCLVTHYHICVDLNKSPSFPYSATWMNPLIHRSSIFQPVWLYRYAYTNRSCNRSAPPDMAGVESALTFARRLGKGGGLRWTLSLQASSQLARCVSVVTASFREGWEILVSRIPAERGWATPAFCCRPPSFW